MYVSSRADSSLVRSGGALETVGPMTISKTRISVALIGIFVAGAAAYLVTRSSVPHASVPCDSVEEPTIDNPGEVFCLDTDVATG